MATSSAAAAAATTTRANYVSRLRRAFLLRVHPDLFRNFSDGIRQEQSKLVKALSTRMSETDFISWQQYKSHNNNHSMLTQHQQKQPQGVVSYVIQRRDGTLLRHKLPLHLSVDRILDSMAEALRQSGAGASLPNPPSSKEPTMFSNAEHESASGQHDDHSNKTDTVDHRFDVVSNRGRSLGCFLKELDPHEVAQRKASRLDAQAVASQVRRLYQFQAVDATALGWSSASVTVLFQRLLDLHAEHGQQIHVSSFHPLRLVFAYADGGHETLDTYGGVLHLSPASTPLQWLNHMQLVTPDVLENIRDRRNMVMQMQKDLQAAWGLKWKKGYSCDSRDFFQFLRRLSQSLPSDTDSDHNHALVPHQSLYITVESPQVCRRPIATRDGAIRLGADMTETQVRSAFERLRPVATQKVIDDQDEQGQCQDLAQKATWLLGLSRLDYRTTGILHATHVKHSLARLVHESDRFKQGLAGHAVGIVGSGRFCHLGDDGAVLIPHDWS